MKTYYLQIITGSKALTTGTYNCICRAASFMILDGVYIFKDEDKVEVACYPVDRTIIYKIENHEQ